MPRTFGAYPSRDDFIHYLEEYQRDLGVTIEYETTVSRIDRTDAGWRVTRADGSCIESHQVVVATGQDNQPVIPKWPGTQSFTGTLIHSGEFGDVAECREKRVLLVGAGNSSVDLANHLSTIDTDAVWMSVRKGSVVVPQWIGFMPTALLTPLIENMPVAVVDWSVNAMSRISCGDLGRYGMPTPTKGALERLLYDGTAPAANNGFIDALRSGRIKIVPEIREFDHSLVRLVNGTELEPDLVVCATGYRSGLTQLVGHLSVLNDQDVPIFDGVEDSNDHPGLWFFGFVNHFLSGSIHERRNEARLLAEKIKQRIAV